MSLTNAPRDSAFDLIRIVAQYFIVFFHIFFYFIHTTTWHPFHKAIWLPFHIGVPLFILISGFFGINSSIRGFIKLIGMIAILYIPLQLTYLFMGNNIGTQDQLSVIFLISATPLWYLRTYVFLYLLAPLINLYLKKASFLQRIYIICALGFISHFVGTIGFDPNLVEGKSVVTFLFLYAIGDTLRVYQHKWRAIPKFWYAVTFIVFNFTLVLIYTKSENTSFLNYTFERFFIAYYSFGLLFNSLLFFCWLGSYKFKSRFISLLGKATLTIYIVHACFLIRYSIIGPIAIKIAETASNQFTLLGLVATFALIIVATCVLIHYALTPVWKSLYKFSDWCQRRFDDFALSKGFISKNSL